MTTALGGASIARFGLVSAEACWVPPARTATSARTRHAPGRKRAALTDFGLNRTSRTVRSPTAVPSLLALCLTPVVADAYFDRERRVKGVCAAHLLPYQLLERGLLRRRCL